MNKRQFKDKRLEICRILVEELLKWKSTTAVTEEEFYKLVDRLIIVK
jgi:hypothetical protein